MEPREGDWVRTERGGVGKIIHISRLTAFVNFKPDNPHPKPEDIQAHLLSQLTKIEPPEQTAESCPVGCYRR